MLRGRAPTTHAVHVRVWLPELAALPACLALEPWRLLAAAEGCAADPGGAPLLPPTRPAWICDACTLENGSEEPTCAACEAPRPRLAWGDFRYGDDYPLPAVRLSICGGRRTDAAAEAEAVLALAWPPKPSATAPRAAVPTVERRRRPWRRWPRRRRGAGAGRDADCAQTDTTITHHHH